MGKLLEMAARVVAAQASGSSLNTNELDESLRRIFNTLQELEKIEAGGELQATAVSTLPSSQVSSHAAKQVDQSLSPKESIRDDHVVCLECGQRFNQITANHLRSHGLTPREYKKKWGFRLKDSLACKNLQKNRSEAAKIRGIPENLKAYQEKKRQEVLGKRRH